jgi:predicted RNA-binding protein with PUA-like domain
VFCTDPRIYHWDTLFVKGKEMWRGAGAKPDALRQIKHVRAGDRVLCYHTVPERALYALAQVTRDPYPDPNDSAGKALVIDLRAILRLPRQVPLEQLRADKALRKVRFLKNLRMTLCPISDLEYEQMLRISGIIAAPGMPLP